MVSWQNHHESGPFFGGGVYVDDAAVGLGDLTADVKTEADAARRVVFVFGCQAGGSISRAWQDASALLLYGILSD
jgi:hypothetical protein